MISLKRSFWHPNIPMMEMRSDAAWAFANIEEFQSVCHATATGKPWFLTHRLRQPEQIRREIKDAISPWWRGFAQSGRSFFNDPER